MSFLTRAAPTTRLAVATPVRSVAASRCFSVSVSHQKGPVEATKETLKKVDRTVSDAAVKGIETGQQAAHKAKETVGYESKKAEGKAQEAAGEAKGKASELQGKAKGKAHEVSGKI